MASILLIERNGRFTHELAKHHEVVCAPNGRQAGILLGQRAFDLAILDSLSLRTPGERTARSLKQQLKHAPLIHLSPEKRSGSESPADVVLRPPVSTRKINNAIARLLKSSNPGNRLLTCGALSIDLERRLLYSNGQEIALTPKLARLVEVFFRNPGVTLPRSMLMEQVWQTDYLGDTRTLDVHVRWIRRAVEADPSHPRLLLTVRGVGYRFERPEAQT